MHPRRPARRPTTRATKALYPRYPCACRPLGLRCRQIGHLMERKQPRTGLEQSRTDFLSAVTPGYLCATTNATVTLSLHTLIALALTAACAQSAHTASRAA